MVAKSPLWWCLHFIGSRNSSAQNFRIIWFRSPSQRPSRRHVETESTSSKSTVQRRRLGRARSRESVMPRQPREQRCNLERIELRPPDIRLRGDCPVLRQSRPVRGQIESRHPSRSSSHEEPPSRKRSRYELDDHRGPADPPEMPPTFLLEI